MNQVPRDFNTCISLVGDGGMTAIEFLKWAYPEGPWLLTAINPDTRKIVSETFTEADRAGAFVAQHNGQSNLYWSVNPPIGKLQKKAKREEIKSVCFFHVDVDPRDERMETDEEKDAHNKAEIERITALLTDNLPKGVPQPSAVIYSGGGCQGFWRLTEPIAIDGNLEKAEDAKLYNLWLEQQFGGDDCHNIDRIMRLPGTTNIPDKKKKAKGRRAVNAKVINTSDIAYDPKDFGKAQAKVQGATSSTAIAVDIPHNIRRLASVEDLNEWDVDKRTQLVILEGKDDDKPLNGEDQSRSAWLFYVVCDLVRKGVPDGVILSVITDKNFAISESVSEKGAPRDYAIRQIKNAKDAVEDHSAFPTGGAFLIEKGCLPEAIAHGQQILKDGCPELFQQNGRLMRVATLEADEIDLETGVCRHRGSVVTVEVNVYWLRERLAACGTWAKIRGKSPVPVPCDPPMEIARHILEKRGEWPFRHLKALVRAPSLTPAGRIIQEPGYDPKSRLYLDIRSGEFPVVPESPTLADALAACERLMSPFRAFPYASEADRSVVLSALLCGFSRPFMQACPAHVTDAPTAGTGKSLLNETIGIIVTGARPPAASQGKSEEEDEKRLASVLLRGDRILLLDNLERPLRGDFLCSMMTQSTVQSRLLGGNENATFETSVLVLVTGNNVQIHGDMGRRCVRCRLNARVERPEDRQFDFRPDDMALANRAQLVVDTLTILRAWHMAGCPGNVGHVGSFEAWTPIRNAIIWLGMSDPAGHPQKPIGLGVPVIHWLRWIRRLDHAASRPVRTFKSP